MRVKREAYLQVTSTYRVLGDVEFESQLHIDEDQVPGHSPLGSSWVQALLHPFPTICLSLHV